MVIYTTMGYWDNAVIGELIVRHRAGDAEASERLGECFIEIATRIVDWRYKKIGYAVECGEIVAQAVYRMWERLPVLDPDRNLHSICTHITNNALAEITVLDKRYQRQVEAGIMLPGIDPAVRWEMARIKAKKKRKDD